MFTTQRTSLVDNAVAPGRHVHLLGPGVRPRGQPLARGDRLRDDAGEDRHHAADGADRHRDRRRPQPHRLLDREHRQRRRRLLPDHPVPRRRSCVVPASVALVHGRRAADADEVRPPGARRRRRRQHVGPRLRQVHRLHGRRRDDRAVAAAAAGLARGQLPPRRALLGAEHRRQGRRRATPSSGTTARSRRSRRPRTPTRSSAARAVLRPGDRRRRQPLGAVDADLVPGAVLAVGRLDARRPRAITAPGDGATVSGQRRRRPRPRPTTSA